MKKDKLTKLLNQDSISESEVSHLLALIRKEIESLRENERKKYPDLKLFCDWALHTEINQSFVGSKLGTEIHKAILKYHKSNSDELIQEISKTLLTAFKKQFKKLLKSGSYNTKIIDNNQIWGVFLDNVKYFSLF